LAKLEIHTAEMMKINFEVEEENEKKKIDEIKLQCIQHPILTKNLRTRLQILFVVFILFLL
jgi:hypothetical protein